LAFPLETEETTASSALATVRLRRRLSIEEAARRSGLSAEELTWLEEGRLYRFAGDEALTAAVLYGAALDISLAEARELAGLPPPELKPAEGRLRRLAVFAALATAVAALVAALLLTGRPGHTRAPTRTDRFDYPRTAVYYEPGGQSLAARLAQALGIATAPLPGGSNRRRLVVIVGPHRGPG
jgi:transcriptional regulator with XRE-family HTH domain